MYEGFLQYLFNNPQFYAAAVMTIIVSITLHELAHGWVAIKLGDNTPNWTGHMTWNPIVHMGPFSLVAAFVAGIAWGLMPVDPTRLRGKYAESLVALAGPATNLILAFFVLTALGIWQRVDIGVGPYDDSRITNGVMVMNVFGSFNLLLFLFNLIPIPPLDGSRILANFSRGYANWAYNPQNSGIILVLFVVGWIILAQQIQKIYVLTDIYTRLIAGA